MPYAVKGMDMSFSGILSYFEDIVCQNPHLAHGEAESIAASENPDVDEDNSSRKRKKNKKNCNKKSNKTKI